MTVESEVPIDLSFSCLFSLLLLFLFDGTKGSSRSPALFLETIRSVVNDDGEKKKIPISVSLEKTRS